uniref:RuvX/YqgF family protein n=1 Tax=Chryseobacterium sp. VD8 TaxID=3081254 RepID=UPI0030163108
DLKGNVSEVEADILKFIEVFQKEFPMIKVHRFDERFTSKMASYFISQSGKNKKKRQEKGLIDKVSATIILQNFLEQRTR